MPCQQKKKSTVKYPKIPSAILPVPHADGLPIPIPPVHYNLESDVAEDCGSEESPCPSSSNDPDFVIDTQESCLPKLFCQAGLNDLIRDLDLPKVKSELLASRLQERNLLLPNVNVSSYRNCQHDMNQYFRIENSHVACCDVPG